MSALLKKITGGDISGGDISALSNGESDMSNGSPAIPASPRTSEFLEDYCGLRKNVLKEVEVPLKYEPFTPRYWNSDFELVENPEEMIRKKSTKEEINFPNFVLEIIFLFLDTKSLNSISQVCWRYWIVGNNNTFWKNYTISQLPTFPHLKINELQLPTPTNWKKFYVENIGKFRKYESLIKNFRIHKFWEEKDEYYKLFFDPMNFHKPISKITEKYELDQTKIKEEEENIFAPRIKIKKKKKKNKNKKNKNKKNKNKSEDFIRNEDRRIYDLLVVGSQGVGKTSLIKYFLEGKLFNAPEPTSKSYMIRKLAANMVTLNIFDSCEFDLLDDKFLRSMLVRVGGSKNKKSREVRGILFLIDLSDPDRQHWIEEQYKRMVNIFFNKNKNKNKKEEEEEEEESGEEENNKNKLPHKMILIGTKSEQRRIFEEMEDIEFLDEYIVNDKKITQILLELGISPFEYIECNVVNNVCINIPFGRILELTENIKSFETSNNNNVRKKEIIHLDSLDVE